MRRWFDGKTAPPFKAVIIPTNRCNLRCSFCPNAVPRSEGKFQQEHELSCEEWLNVAKQGLDFGIREWSIIGGGEPMIRYDAVIPLVEAVKGYKESTDCEIITNGTLFREDEIIRLVSFKLDRVLFSIDGPNPEIHDNLRGVRGSFERASKNLKSFSEWKKKLKTDKPYLKVNMVLNAKNIGRIAEMVRFLKEADAQELALHPMREYWKSASQTNSLKLDEREADLLKDNIGQARKISKELGIFLNTDMLTVERGGVEEKNKSGLSNELTEKIMGLRCFEPFYTMLIDPQGNAAPCSPVGRGLPNSNVLRLGLSQIWYENFGETRENILKNVSYDYCRNCGLLDMHEHLRKKMIEFVGKNSRKNS